MTTVVDLLRHRAFDATTPEGRSSERYRRALRTSIASVSLRSASLVSGLISVPIAIHYLGAERYGLWQTIAAAVGLLTFADLGLGNSLMNAISAAKARDDRTGAIAASSSGFFMLAAIAVVIVAIFAASYRAINWPSVFNVTSPVASQEAGPSTAIFVACVALAIPLSVVQRIQFGNQDGLISNLWSGAGNIGALIGLVAAVRLNLGLPGLVLAMIGVPQLALALNWIQEFGFSRPWLLPKVSQFRLGVAAHLGSRGFLFLILQAAAIITYSSDTIVASRFLGPNAVAQFSVAQRVFILVPTFIGLAAMPLWPAFTEAYARGDLPWVRRTFIRCLVASLAVSVAAALILIVSSGPLVSLWVGAKLSPSLDLSVALATWSVLFVWAATFAVLINSTRGIGFEAIVVSIATIASIALKIALAPHYGLAGIVWGGVIAYLMFLIAPCGAYLILRFRSESHRQAMPSAAT